MKRSAGFLRTAAVTLSLILLMTGCARPQPQPRPESPPSGESPHARMPMAEGRAAPFAVGNGIPLAPLELAKLAPLPALGAIAQTGKLREYKLEAKPGKWEVIPGVTTEAATFNRTVPGPVLRATEGDTVRVVLTNSLDKAITIHWHGLHVPNPVDGVPPITQEPVNPGETYTYEFTASHAGTFLYHPHLNSVELVDKGLYGAFIIDPQSVEGQPKFDRDVVMVLSGWMIPGATPSPGEIDPNMKMGMAMPGKTAPYQGMFDKGIPPSKTTSEGTEAMSMEYNYWTINGKAFPATEPVMVKKGERVRLRLINISNAAHPMHLHGMDFRLIAKDGHPIASPQIQTVFNVAPGETADLEFLADNPGEWVFHCHELHHSTNNGVEPGGLMTVVKYES